MPINSIILKRSGRVVVKVAKFFFIVIILSIALIVVELIIDIDRCIAVLTVFLCIIGMVMMIRHISRDRVGDYYSEDAIYDICILWFLSLLMAAVVSYAISKHFDTSDKVFEEKIYEGYSCVNSDIDILRSGNSTIQELRDEDIYDYVEDKSGKKLEHMNEDTFKSIKREDLVFRPNIFYHMDEYIFWFSDLVPILEIPKTLEICPAIKTNDFGIILRLIFKIYVVFVFFGVTRKLWTAAQERRSGGIDG